MIKNNWYPNIKQKENWQKMFAFKQENSIEWKIIKYKKKLGYTKLW